MHDHELHDFIVARIETALGDRTWRWLAHKSGVPVSTLHGQKYTKFTVRVLLRVAAALEMDVTDLLP